MSKLGGCGVFCIDEHYFHLFFCLLWFSFALQQFANAELVNTNFILKQEHILKPPMKRGSFFFNLQMFILPLEAIL